MQRMLARRALSGIAVVAGVVTLTFLLLHAAPGDPAERLIGPTATPEQLAAGRHALGLDRPMLDAIRQLAGPLRPRRLGHELRHRPSGADDDRGGLARHRPPGRLSLLLSYGLGLAVGAVQAARSPPAARHRPVGGERDPGGAAGLLARADAVMVFTYLLRVLPAFGAAGYDADYLSGWARFVDGARHLALPLATLTLIGVGAAARFVRGAMLDALEQPFVDRRAGQGAHDDPRDGASRPAQRADSGRHAAGPVAPGAVLGRGVRRGGVRLAGRGTGAGGGGAGARLPGGDGGHRHQRAARRRRQPAGGRRGRVRRSPLARGRGDGTP